MNNYNDNKYMKKYCLIKGTKISLINNIKNIEDLKLNETVLVCNIHLLKPTHNLRNLETKYILDFNSSLDNGIIKNIWVNKMIGYYNINNILKITGEHFIFIKRKNQYFWTNVDNLKLNDFMYHQSNKFIEIETIDFINEKRTMYSIETTNMFNYFANGFLVHNTSCDSCTIECGGTPPIIKEFAFNTEYYDSTNSTSTIMNTYANNWTTFGSVTDYSTGETTTLSAIDNNYLKDERISFSYGDDADSSIENSSSSNSYFSSRLRTDGTPPYSARVLLPFFNTTDCIEVWFKITNISTEYYGDRVGIGIIHKLTDNSNPMNLSWTTDYDNKHLNITDATHILSDAKICMRLFGDVSFGITDEYFTTNSHGNDYTDTDTSVKQASGNAQVSGHGNGYYSSIDHGTHSNIVSGTYSNGDYVGISVYYNKYIDTQFIQFKKYSSNTLTLFPPNPKPIAQTVQGNNNTKTLSTLNSNSIDDGPWGVYVFDSTDSSNKVDFTVVESPIKVKNYLRVYYHRYGSEFKTDYTPSNLNYTIESGTFVVYFWNATSHQTLRLGTRIVNEQHTSTTSAYSYIDYEILLPNNTEGKILFLIYGWKYFTADMAIGKVELLYSDQTTVKDILFQPNSNQNTAMNNNYWYNTNRNTISTSNISVLNVSDLEDEIASKVVTNSWYLMAHRTISNSGGWHLDTGGTGSSGTGPSVGQDNSSSSYYIYVETSSYSSTTDIAYAGLYVPIKIESKSIINKLEFKYHRYGSTFNNTLSVNNVSLYQGSFICYFWNKATSELTYMGSIEEQTHTSNSSSFLTATFSIEQEKETSGYFLFILYGWQNYMADMAITNINQLSNTNNVIKTLYYDHNDSTTAKNNNSWERNGKILHNISDINSNNKTEIHHEIASNLLINENWVNLSSGTSTYNGWQQDTNHTVSSSTGPSSSHSGSTSHHYIYVETSSQTSTTVLPVAALRLPVNIEEYTSSSGA